MGAGADDDSSTVAGYECRGFEVNGCGPFPGDYSSGHASVVFTISPGEIDEAHHRDSCKCAIRAAYFALANA